MHIDLTAQSLGFLGIENSFPVQELAVVYNIGCQHHIHSRACIKKKPAVDSLRAPHTHGLYRQSADNVLEHGASFWIFYQTRCPELDHGAVEIEFNDIP